MRTSSPLSTLNPSKFMLAMFETSHRPHLVNPNAKLSIIHYFHANPNYPSKRKIRNTLVLTLKSKCQALDKSFSFQFTSGRNHASTIDGYKILNLTLNLPKIMRSRRPDINMPLIKSIRCYIFEESLAFCRTHVLLRK